MKMKNMILSVFFLTNCISMVSQARIFENLICSSANGLNRIDLRGQKATLSINNISQGQINLELKGILFTIENSNDFKYTLRSIGLPVKVESESLSCMNEKRFVFSQKIELLANVGSGNFATQSAFFILCEATMKDVSFKGDMSSCGSAD